MARLQFVPERGAILIGHFDEFREPEITKRRPVVVLSPKFKERFGYCTVVPMSTTDPHKVCGYHYRMRMDPPLPFPYDKEWCWVKCDMIYTASFDRLTAPLAGKDENGKRIYVSRRVSDEDMRQIERCVMLGLGISALTY